MGSFQSKTNATVASPQTSDNHQTKNVSGESSGSPAQRGPHTADLYLNSRKPIIHCDKCFTSVLENHKENKTVVELISVRDACIEVIPVSIGIFENLQVLDMSENCITDVPWYIVYLKKLRILDLSDNQLKSLPGAIGYLPELEELYVKGNQLRSLPTELLYLQKLKVVDASKNPMISPPSEVCSQGVQEIKRAMRKRAGRSNVWEFAKVCLDKNVTHNEEDTDTLYHLSLQTILKNKVNFFIMNLPPAVKKVLAEEHAVYSCSVNVAKCNICEKFYSCEETFQNHTC